MLKLQPVKGALLLMYWNFDSMRIHLPCMRPFGLPFHLCAENLVLTGTSMDRPGQALAIN